MENREDWVISGLSGRFPDSENSEIFWQHLIQGKDMVSDNPRWDAETFETPRRAGKIPLIEKFDASFFGVSGTQANKMDPKIRIALEVVYEAVIDAGINPKSLRGARVGVFMSSSGNDAADVWLRSTENRTGHYITGCYPCMLADRISYAFNFKGPTCVVDTGCSSSFSAIQYAMLALKNGLCDSAIVGGANINTFPYLSSAFFNFKALSPDGKCKVFDASADGFVRSEAVVAFYICRNACAKRIYATILGIKCINDGYKEDGITVPSSRSQAQLIKEVYEEAGVNPMDVFYVEAHGTGTQAGDPKEITAIDDVFCKERREPLLVGSVKSNMGHAELVSGLCGIVKVLLARRYGVIPPNLHFKTPNPECEALIKGRINVVVEATPFQGRLVGVNSFGIGGTTGHAILQFENISNSAAKWRIKTKTLLKLPPLKKNSSLAIPTLILASGRTKKAVEHLLDQAAKHFEDTDFLGLLHEVAGIHTNKHRFVGFAIINENESEIKIEMSAKPENPQAMWYVYTGLGSQWVGMATEMRKFKAFNHSVQLSSQHLRKVGVDLYSILMCEDKLCINSLQNAFVAITACQIALTDLVGSLDIYPDTMTGQSLGEVACGYTDGCLTRDQALLASYYRARAFMESDIPPGTMANTGLTWEEAQIRCPPDIFPAIHSAKNNVTISGPNQSITQIVELLKNEGIFAKQVESAMQAYHSPYVRNSEKNMLNLLKNAIPENTRRSQKWLSSSIPTDNWESELSQYCSAEYLVNNAMSPVLLHQVFQYVPHNSLVVEIGAHCFLQTILKQSLAVTVTVIGLMHWNHDNSNYFLSAIGNIFNAGFEVKCSALYEPLKFPVSLETLSLSPLIKWDHTASWEVPHFENERSLNQGLKFVVNLSSDEFLTGHLIEENIIFPATGYIYLVWKAFAKLHYKSNEDTPVVLENINFKRMRILVPNQDMEFIINVFNACGNFEIFESTEIVCTGNIYRAHKEDQEMFSSTSIENPVENVLDHDDFYKLLILKGYDYQGLFRGVRCIETNGMWAKLAWNDNWISFLDTMLQTCILHNGLSFTNELVVPVRLDSVTIFPTMFKESLKNDSAIVSRCIYTDAIECPGIRLCGLKLSLNFAITPLIEPTITVQKFCAFNNDTTESIKTTLEVFVGIVLDNSDIMETETFVFTEVTDGCQTVDLNLQSLMYFKFKFYEHRVVQTTDHASCNSDCVSKKTTAFGSILDMRSRPLSNLICSNQESDVFSYMDLLAENGFLIITMTNEISPDLTLIAKHRTENGNICLIKRQHYRTLKTVFVSIDLPDFRWIDILKEKCVSAQHGNRIHIISRSSSSGIIGFTKCVIKELEWSNIRCVYIQDAANVYTEFEMENEILKNDLVFNVYVNGSWGTYANISVNELEISRNTELAHAEIRTVGDLTSICWVESPFNLNQQTNYEIHFSAINFKDILFATGKIPKNVNSVNFQGHAGYIGFEFSGKCGNTRVFGLSDGKCLATALGNKPRMVWDVPDHWSLAEAVTVPAVYSTVLYSFFIRGKLKEGERVLIHSGSGGIGMAAITIALNLKCTVYTTVGSRRKRDILKAIFPKLLEDRILDSNNGKKFKMEILRQTKGEGVDVVLNSLSQDKLKASLECLGRRGRFLEIGKLDSLSNNLIGLATLLRSVDIQGIHLDDVLQSNEVFQLQTLMQEYLNEGKLKPLPFKCFRHDQIQDAFNYFASRKHVGKVIIEVRGPSGGANVRALPRTYFGPANTYIIIGGLGGMGLEMVTWMIGRGARKLFVVSRSGLSSSYQKYMVNSWIKCGATIFLKDTNISSNSDVSKLIQEAISVGPLGGVFNLALELQDAMFVNQTPKSFDKASKCKATATVIFDALSRKYAPGMEYFVLFSSLISGRGNAGQSNYGYANSVMERICEQRKFDGFSAISIQWGPVSDVGSVGKIFRRTRVVDGCIGQTISSCISTLDLLLQQNETVVGSFVLPPVTQNYARESKYVPLSQNVARILGISDLKSIDVNTTLTEHGMDSIMAAQIKHSIQRKRAGFIPSSGYGSLTFNDLILMD